MTYTLLLVALLRTPFAIADTGSTGAPTAPTPGNITVVPRLPRGTPMVDSIVVEKRAHRLSLYYNGRRVRSYLVALGANPAEDKFGAGDRRTPQGVFWVDYRNPESQYHRALHLTYPDSAHLARAVAKGVPPGGDIMIHGLPNGLGAAGASHRENDWTNGCIALTDEEIDEIFAAVDVGTPVEIRP